MTEIKPKRRWFRFSLRTLFVLVTIAGLAAGWVLHQLNWLEQRREFTKHGFPGFGQYENPSPWPLSLLGEQGYTWVGVPVVNDEGYRLTNEGWPEGFDFDKLLTPQDKDEIARVKATFSGGKHSRSYISSHQDQNPQ